MTTFILFTAATSGLVSNTHYPNQATITDAAGLEAAARFDHVAAEYQGGQRATHGFVTSNCLVMDIDNDYTENPEDWVTPQHLADLLTDVELMTATSRNHDTSKHGTPARPRFHVYLPIGAVIDPGTYAGLKKSLAGRFDFFDAGALDAARFLYGHPAPQVKTFTGSTLVDEWLTRQAEADAFAAFDAATLAIGEGSRNATLSRFAGRVLIRYGDTDQARTLFDRKAALCDPPLPTPELEAIWRSALRFAGRIAKDPTYVKPAVYQALTSLKPDDYTDVGQAEALATEYADKIRYSLSTHWLVYEGGVWVENDLLAQAVAQELTARQLDEAQNMLDQAHTLMADTAAADTIAAAPSKTKGVASLSDTQQVAYQRLLEAMEYHKFVLGRRQSRNIAATLKEAQPLLEVRASDLDCDSYLLCTPGGTYQLTEGLASKRDNHPAALITLQTATSPGSEGTDLWRQALEVTFQGDEDLIGYVQRVCGLAAIGKVMLEALIIAYGDGRNGKSTFWNTIARVLGTYSGSISADTLTVGGAAQRQTRTGRGPRQTPAHRSRDRRRRAPVYLERQTACLHRQDRRGEEVQRPLLLHPLPLPGALHQPPAPGGSNGCGNLEASDRHPVYRHHQWGCGCEELRRLPLRACWRGDPFLGDGRRTPNPRRGLSPQCPGRGGGSL